MSTILIEGYAEEGGAIVSTTLELLLPMGSNDVDTLIFSSDAYALDLRDGDAVFDFGGGNVLTVVGNFASTTAIEMALA